MFLLLALLSTSYALQLTIAHTNDVHARLSQTEVTGGYNNCDDPASVFDNSTHSAWFTGCHGGAARHVTVMNQMRAENENVLLLDGGDQFQGTLWYNIYKGEKIAHVVNTVGYDVITFGNHEFDDGESVLAEYLDRLNDSVHLLSANVDADPSSLIFGKYTKSWTFDMADGSKVGVVGYVTPDAPSLSNPGPLLTFNDLIPSIQAEVDALQTAGVDVIAGVGHVGWSVDLDIASQVSGIDIVIGGHTDTFCYTGNPLDQSAYAYPTEGTCEYPTVVTGADGQMVCVAQAFTYGTWIGKMDVTVENGLVTNCGGQPIFVSGETIEQDPDMLAFIVDGWSEIENAYGTIYGQSRAFGNGQKPIMRSQEAALGNLFTDAAVDIYQRYAENVDDLGTRISMTNAGGLRADFPKGDVSLGTLMSICPFGNDITELKNVPASVILEALEHGVSKWDENDGRFGHWSGVRFSFDPELPAFSRVTEAWILDPEPAGLTDDVRLIPLTMDSDKTWNIITSVYIAKGGDSYTMLEQYWDGVGGYFVDYDILVKYVEEHTPVIPRLDGRIKYTNVTALVGKGACWDHSIHCATLSANCLDDGTITVEGGHIYCYETCNMCPNAVVVTVEPECPEATTENAAGHWSTTLLVVLFFALM